jgi:hypothetical protein
MNTGVKGSSGAGGGYLSMAAGGNYVDQVQADAHMYLMMLLVSY